ncbi:MULTISPECIES: ABC transporter ATP-binding protein [Protofrankia]|uniref:Oligopeptide/dipeptide ABC transporter, ATPase subunit n=1 Tax=Candidatus Protofrankia datiscae TaxID=2716812 RepID=F8AXS3_9ACTN|nr:MULTISPECIES: ABC transporter ATP-binding protein [Protofrankia]AEH11491.1 oligopeptide/dipeptide ABC transporter, ATPase subunit [Candidatus Protofrankia datiscae]
MSGPAIGGAVDRTVGSTPAGATGPGTSEGLVVDGLSVSYPASGARAAAVDGVSLRVRPGESYGLVGESGSGKSTLAAALAGVLPDGGRVEHGSIHLDGVDVGGLPERDRRRWRAAAFAMVHQGATSSLDPTVRVGAQVAEACRLQGLSRAAARGRALELLAAVRLPEPAVIARRWPHQLSGGQQQRVGIAAALASRPRLLVLDEPTTGLDAAVAREILDLLQVLRQEISAAVVLISHDLALVARRCDRMGVLYAGCLVEEGRAADLLTAPRHPYTAGLVAAAPAVGVTRRERRLLAIAGQPPAPTERPGGCTFADRCALVDQTCRTREPPLAPVPPLPAVPVPAAVSAPAAVVPPDRLAGPGRRPDAYPDEHTVRCHHSDRTTPHLPAQATEVDDAGPGPGPGPGLGPAPDPRPGLLSVRGLSRGYGRTPVLDGIDLDIGYGEVLGLVGESGSGKTTLARALVGLGPDGPGELRLAGRLLPARLSRRSAEDRRRVQMVFQDPDTTLNPRHSVSTVLRRALVTLRGSGTVTDLAGRVQLGPSLLPLRTARLSGGQKQRVAIGRAFAGEPELVVCDEPVSALDVSVQAVVLELLAAARDTGGVSYLFISHDLAVVGYLADRLAVLYQGQIAEVGPTSAVLSGPHHPYTDSLTGDGVPGQVSGRPDSAGRVGCRFAWTCPHRLDGLCDRVAPPVRLLSGPVGAPAHTVRCHLELSDLPRAASTPLAGSGTRVTRVMPAAAGESVTSGRPVAAETSASPASTGTDASTSTDAGTDTTTLTNGKGVRT